MESQKNWGFHFVAIKTLLFLWMNTGLNLVPGIVLSWALYLTVAERKRAFIVKSD